MQIGPGGTHGGFWLPQYLAPMYQLSHRVPQIQISNLEGSIMHEWVADLMVVRKY